MPDRDPVRAARQLTALAWPLAILAVLAWVRFALLLDGPRSLDTELGLWLAGAVVCTVAAGCSAALASINLWLWEAPGRLDATRADPSSVQG